MSPTDDAVLLFVDQTEAVAHLVFGPEYAAEALEDLDEGLRRQSPLVVRAHELQSAAAYFEEHIPDGVLGVVLDVLSLRHELAVEGLLSLEVFGLEQHLQVDHDVVAVLLVVEATFEVFGTQLRDDQILLLRR